MSTYPPHYAPYRVGLVWESLDEAREHALAESIECDGASIGIYQLPTGQYSLAHGADRTLVRWVSAGRPEVVA